MLFSLLKHYLDLYLSDTSLKVSRALYCFTTSICHGVENCFPRLWGMGISDTIFSLLINAVILLFYYATIAYHVGLNAVLGLPHPGPTP